MAAALTTLTGWISRTASRRTLAYRCRGATDQSGQIWWPFRWTQTAPSTTSRPITSVIVNLAAAVYVRDTKDGGAGPVLAFSRESWRAFVAQVARRG